MADLGLIDLSSIWWQQWHATADLEVGEAARRTRDRVHQYASGHDYVAVCCDWPPYKRNAILPSYKAQRITPSEVAREQFARVKDELRKRYPVLEADGYEADDVIATVVWGRPPVARRREEHCDSVTVYSSDKDLLQLVDDRVRVVSVSTGEVFHPDQVRNKFGVWPMMMTDLLALWGDKGDNIPGVPGIGVKRAAQLLQEYGGFEAVFSAANDGAINGAIGNALRANYQAAAKARALVELMTNAPIDVDSIFAERKMEVAEEETMEEGSEPVQAEVVEPEQTAQPEEPKAHQAIVVAPKWEHALEPVNSGMAVKLAAKLYESRLFGKAFGNPEAILAVILRGRALGIDATTALSNFNVIKGRLGMSAQLLIGLVVQHRVCEYLEWTESDAQHAVWVAKRVGGKTEKTLKWDLEDACAAGLLERNTKGRDGYRGLGDQSSNWDKYRPAMLRWRCGVELARSVFPDVVAGLYTPEELE